MKKVKKHYRVDWITLTTRLVMLTCIVVIAAAIIRMIPLASQIFDRYYTNSEYKGTYSTVVVQNGDSIWSIAHSLSSGTQDTRMIVNRIYELNNLNDVTIKPGTILKIPTYGSSEFIASDTRIRKGQV